MTSATFDPSGRHVLTSSMDRTARVWDIDEGQSVSTLPHDGMVYTAAYDRTGRHMVTASCDRAVRVWDAENPAKPLRTIDARARVWLASFGPGGRILTSSSDNAVRIWNPDGTEAQKAMTSSRSGLLYSAVFSPDGRRVITAWADNTARVFDVASGEELLVLYGHRDDVESATYDPQGARCDRFARQHRAHLGAAVPRLRAGLLEEQL